MHDLIYELGIRQIAQAHAPQVAQRNSWRQAVGDQCDHRLRHEYLSAMRCIHDARGAIDHRAEEVVVAALIDAGVQAAAHAQRNADGRYGIGERNLQLQRRCQRVERIVEHGVKSVTGRFHDSAAVLLDCLAGQDVMTCQSRPHALGFLIPQSRAALYIRE